MKQLLQDMKSGETFLAEVPAPRATPGQLLARVRASAVSAGTERMLVDFAKSGLLGKARRRPDLVRQALAKARRDGLMSVWNAAQSRLDQPLPLGYSCAGIVEALGEGVDGFSVGDRVACAGAGYANHAEFVVVPQNLCVRLPTNVPFEDAAFATLGAIALQGLRLAQAKLGENVAVIGLGLLGQLAARLAKASGCRVFGVDVSDARLDPARKAGIEAVSRENAEAAGSAFTEGLGFDCVLICADGATNDPIELAAALARDRGVVVAVGNVALDVPRNAFYRKELALRVSRSYGPGRYDPVYEEAGLDYPYGYVRWTERRNIAEFLRLLSEKAVDLAPLITHRLPFDAGLSAYELIASPSGSGAIGVVLAYDDTAPRDSVPAPPAGAVAGDGVGVLGAGQFAASVMLPLLRKSRAPLRGIASPSGTRAASAAKRFGFAFASSSEQEVVADPQASTIVVLTRHSQHAAQVRCALKADRNVFVEKPLCLSLEELESIEQALQGSKGALGVGFNRRSAPFSLELRGALACGPKAIQIRVNAGALPPGHWSLDPAEGGRLLGEGCHFIDWANFVAGSAPTEADCRPIGRTPSEQDWSLRLSYSDGTVADIIYTSGGDGAAGKERYEAHGDGVSAVIEDFRILHVYRGGRHRAKRTWLKADKGHEAHWLAFWGAVSRGKPAPVSWGDIAATMRATLAAQRSLRSGKPEAVGS